MKKLIIISGISGVGKSTLARKMHQKIENSTLISLDFLAENIYDIMGFKNKEQKKSLQLLYKKVYKMLVEEAMKRSDEAVIVEYPFKKEWIKFFEKMIDKYDYQVYTIHLFAKDFDTIWERLKIRENSKERHPSHYLQEYNLKNKEKYKPYFEYGYNTLKREYDKLISNCINLGKLIKVEDIEELDIDKCIKLIVEDKQGGRKNGQASSNI